MKNDKNQGRWVERQFRFENLEGTYPNIIERLRDTPLRLRNKLEGLSQEVLTDDSHEGWSMQVHAGHLLTLESLWLGRLDDFYQKNETLRAWNPTNEETELAGFNLQSTESILQGFDEVRSGMVGVLERFKGQEEHMISNHPRLKTPMRLLDLVYFIAEHDDHHLASIQRLKAAQR